MGKEVGMNEATSMLVGRRRFFLSGAGALIGIGTATPALTEAAAHDGGSRAPRPLPKPIPGGLDPGANVHAFVPGPPTITLPFSGLTLQGLDVEPSAITDFHGRTALAYIIGEATGSDGVTYGLEADIRAFAGEYVAASGGKARGAFAFV
jgi:hypothetical protein